MRDSIRMDWRPEVAYLLRIGDTCLIHAQRQAEWSGHAPVLEEDIALTNIGLDLLGQARAVLTLAATLQDPSLDEDQLAFLREEHDYRNLTLVELPRGDFADAMTRGLLLSTWLGLLWEGLAGSGQAELAGIAAKAVKEAAYHQRHHGDWFVRLADGTDESRRRIDDALARLWPYTREMFQSDAIDAAAVELGLGVDWASLRSPWQAGIERWFEQAGVPVPGDGRFLSEGRLGRHSEHMGYILSQMQYLQRAYPGGQW